MGFLILALLGYFFFRRVLPNATCYLMMTADSKILVILLLIASLVTGITSHVPLAEVVLFPLCLAFAITVFEGYSQSADDVPRPSPFVASLTSRAPPLF